MNVKEIIEEVKNDVNPYEAAKAIDLMFWVKFVRRHKASYFDVHFHDKETITDEDITYNAIYRVMTILSPHICEEYVVFLPQILASSNNYL